MTHDASTWSHIITGRSCFLTQKLAFDKSWELPYCWTRPACWKPYFFIVNNTSDVGLFQSKGVLGMTARIADLEDAQMIELVLIWRAESGRENLFTRKKPAGTANWSTRRSWRQCSLIWSSLVAVHQGSRESFPPSSQAILSSSLLARLHHFAHVSNRPYLNRSILHAWML